MNNRLYDIGDEILKSIRDNRTPLTDALVHIIVVLVISVSVLWLLETLFTMLQRKAGRNEADQYTVRFIFTMIRYVVLIASILIILRSCIAEITQSKSSKLQDTILWLHSDTVTIYDYGIKILLALIVFIIFNAVQNGIFKVLQRHMDNKGVRERFSHFILNLVRYILLAFLTVASSLQLMLTDGDNLIALAVFIYLCIMIAVPTRVIRRILSKENRTVEFILTLIGRIGALLVLIAVTFGIYGGLKYFLGSGGQEISDLLRLQENTIAEELGTEFESNPELGKRLSANSKYHITVKTDGELNLIYLDGKLTGINTSGRAYQFFGVSVNQPEITAAHEMTYRASGNGWEMEDLMGGVSRSHYYYNTKNNDCLVLTVNRNSNRVVSVTFYNNYHLIAGTRTLTEE